MNFEQEPSYEPPSEFLRSAALFILTMGTVFGLGMVWTNYGDQIAARWNKDWNGMQDGWAQATTPPEKEPGSGSGLLGLMNGSAFGGDGFGHGIRPADTSRLRSNRPVVPMIDRSKLQLKKVDASGRR
jgi:hypothetical protein